VSGAPLPADALDLPASGALAEGAARPLALVMAAAAAQAMGIHLRVEKGALEVSCAAEPAPPQP
jgi:hypothetical protein